LNGIPAISTVTVATFNLFDNGADQKVKWSSARYSMNIQLFTQTTPFTPSVQLADWYSTVQLHDPDFWISYIDHKANDKKIDQPTYDSLKAAYYSTYNDHPKTALMGTVTDKNYGTNYSWPYYLRFWYDEFNEPNLEVYLDDKLPTIDIWDAVKPVEGKVLPILRARYNPLGLWKARKARATR
jgi:hypothetical protein